MPGASADMDPLSLDAIYRLYQTPQPYPPREPLLKALLRALQLPVQRVVQLEKSQREEVLERNLAQALYHLHHHIGDRARPRAHMGEFLEAQEKTRRERREPANPGAVAGTINYFLECAHYSRAFHPSARKGVPPELTTMLQRVGVALRAEPNRESRRRLLQECTECLAPLRFPYIAI